MNKIDTRNIANTLFRIRSAKHLSQNSFAKIACSQGMLSKIENDTTSPTFNKVLALLQHMDISLSEFDFLLLESQRSRKQQNNASIEELIDTYQFYLLSPHFKETKSESHHAYINIFKSWCHYCFNIKLDSINKPDTAYMLKLLNQDEFFNHDFRKLIYGLPTLELESAFYNYNRIQSQLETHQYGETKPYLVIDAALTIACIFWEHNNKSEAYHHFYFALQYSKKIVDIQRLIICSIILSCISNNPTFIDNITPIKAYFSKDIFYDYWYNTLYTKFKEV